MKRKRPLNPDDDVGSLPDPGPVDERAARQIVAGVMQHAIADLYHPFTQAGTTDSSATMVRDQARRWFESDADGISDDTGITFLGACRALGLVPAQVRKRVLAGVATRRKRAS